MTKLTLSVLALTSLAVPGYALADVPDSCGTAVAELTKTWSKSDSFGDENFGASYAASATLQGKRDGLSVAGNLNADASVFGSTQNIVKVTGKAEAAVVARTSSESLDVFVVGKNIFHHSRSSGTGSGSGVTLSINKNWDVTFFSADKRFWAGPIPVKVKATPRIRPDAVFMAHGFGQQAPGLTNAYGKGASDAQLITRYALDPISGGAGLRVNFVKIIPAAGAK